MDVERGILRTQAAAVDMAMDLLMLDFAPLLAVLVAIKEHRADSMDLEPLTFLKSWPWEKLDAFYRLTVALHAARSASNDFRIAHVEEEKKRVHDQMQRQFQEELARIDGLTPEEIAARRAS